MVLTQTGAPRRADRTHRLEARTQALKTASTVMEALARGEEVPALEGVRVRDASSALNLNWIRADLLEKTSLKNWLLEGRSASAFEQDRSDQGFSTDPAQRWADWFRLDLLESKTTVWGPWPVNAGDELALELAFVERTGDKAAAVRFREGLRRARQERKSLDAGAIRALAAPHGEAVSGLFSPLPPWNANTIPEDLLRALTAYPPLALPDPAATASALINARATSLLGAGTLPRLLSLPPDHPLFTYLGTVTLVWRIEVSAGDETLVSHWMRGAEPLAGRPPVYRPLDRSWEKEKTS